MGRRTPHGSVWPRSCRKSARYGVGNDMSDPAPSDPQLAVLEKLYGAAARELAGLLGKSTWQTGKAARLIRQVRRISHRLGVQTDRWAAGQAMDAYRAGARFADGQLAQIGEMAAALRIDNFLQINERAVAIAAGQIAGPLAAANAQLAGNARRIIAATGQRVLGDAQVAEAVAQGLISGGSLNQIARGLRARLTEAGRELLDSGKMSPAELRELADFEGGYIQAGRSRMRIDQYCRLVAHHQLRRVTTEATKQRLVETGEELGDRDAFDLVIISGPISGDFCDLYVGKVYSISGRSSEYPPLSSIPEGGPPFHPNCTHVVAPFVARLATARERERGKTSERVLGLSGADAQRAYMGVDRRLAARR